MPETHENCPCCGKRVVQQGADGTLKIRTPLVVFRKGQVVATVVCQRCGASVEIDMRMGPELLKSLAAPKLKIGRRVVIGGVKVS